MEEKNRLFQHLWNKTKQPLTVNALLSRELINLPKLAEQLTAQRTNGRVVDQISHDVLDSRNRPIETTLLKPRVHSRGKCYSASKKVRTKQGSDLDFNIYEPKTKTIFRYRIPARVLLGMKEVAIPLNIDGTYKRNKYSDYLEAVEPY
jgi:hypothetical protein